VPASPVPVVAATPGNNRSVDRTIVPFTQVNSWHMTLLISRSTRLAL
jgi:hypothetical protein